MKGITPVVAIILLLLITISMVGFAFVWFTRVGELTTQQTQQQLQSQLDAQAQKVRIDSIDKTNPMKITIRNVGSKAIPLPYIVGFRNNIKIDCKTLSTDTPGDTLFSASTANTLAVGATITCKDASATPAPCVQLDNISITAPGNTDKLLCP